MAIMIPATSLLSSPLVLPVSSRPFGTLLRLDFQAAVRKHEYSGQAELKLWNQTLEQSNLQTTKASLRTPSYPLHRHNHLIEVIGLLQS